MARIGIDLGTFNSAAAIVLGDGLPVTIEGRDGESIYGKTYPSFVFFDANGEVKSVGQIAKNDWARNPTNVVWGVKRLVGLSYDQAYGDEDGFRRFGYRDRIQRADDGGIEIRFVGRAFSPTDILAIILRYIKEDAENVTLNPLLNGKVDGAVITVPAYFDPTRVGPVLHAAELAGFGKVEMDVTEISEPTSATMCYVNANRRRLPRDGKGMHVLTFDIGAGTTDVTVNRVDAVEGDLLATEVSIEGDNACGGLDMDYALLDLLIEKYPALAEMDDVSKARIQEKVEQSKIELSEDAGLAKVAFRSLIAGKPTSFEITREEMVNRLGPVWDRAVLPLHELFREAKRRANVTPDRIDLVLFIGGPTRMPELRHRIREELAEIGVPQAVLARIDAIDTEGFPAGNDPMKSVALGAALSAEGRVFSTKLVPYGFGVPLGRDYYHAVLKDNQPAPTREEKLSLWFKSHSNRVTVVLARKTCDTDPDDKTVSRAKYWVLGQYDFYLPGSQDVPTAEVCMSITENRRLITRIVHKESGHSVTYANVDLMTGEEAELQEDTPPGQASADEYRAVAERVRTERRGWSTNHLQRAVHAARAVSDLGEPGSCREARAALQQSAARATRPDADPNHACPDVLNRALELLASLHREGSLSETDFKTHRDELRNIEKG